MRDMLFIAGAATIAVGGWLVHPACGLIFAGVVAVLVALGMRKAEE